MQNVKETVALAQNNFGGRKNETLRDGALSQSTKEVTFSFDASLTDMVADTSVCMGEKLESTKIWLALTKTITAKVMASENCTVSTTEELNH